MKVNILNYIKRMKKILEVLESSNGELKFNMDVDVMKDPESVIDITGRAIFTMATKLWGGNEKSCTKYFKKVSHNMKGRKN